MRGFRRTPAFPAAVLVILGLGIGAAIAMFSAFHAILVRKLPVAEQNRLAVLWPYRVRGAEIAPPNTDLAEVARRSRTMHDVAGVAHWGVAEFPFVDGDRTVTLQMTMVTANYFSVLGATPSLGRFFRAEDGVNGAPAAMVLSYRAWQSRFNGSASVIGRRLIDPWTHAAATVVGVARAGLDYPIGAECWTSITAKDSTLRVLAVARLRPDATISAARSEYFSLIERLEPTWKLTGADATSFTSAVLGDVRPALIALTAAVGLLLLIACVNVGTLFLIRAGARAREISIRRALGASYGDIVRQLVAESALLALGGGVLGAWCAMLMLRALVRLAPAHLPRLDEIQLHGNVIAIAIGVTIFSVLLFGVVPAFAAARVNLATPLRHDARSGTETRRRRRQRDWLVASQVALALVMLCGAGLLARSLVRLEQLDLGYRAEHLAIMSFAYDPKTLLPADTSYRAAGEAIVAAGEQFDQRLHTIPGVTAVTPLMTPPFAGTAINVGLLEAEGQTQAEVEANPTIPWEVAGQEFFRTFDTPILRGRSFGRGDRDGTEPVVIVSESVARRFWRGQDAIGKRLRFAPSSQRAGSPLPKVFSDWRTVVGIVPDTRLRELRTASSAIYLPWRQVPNVWGSFAVRWNGDIGATTAEIRRALKELNPSYTLWYSRTLDDLLGEPLAKPRLSAFLLSAFGVVALILASVGLYGVMTSTVREQTREIGIRVALGATPAVVRNAIVRRALVVTMIGGVVGLVAALFTTRLLRSLLFQVGPTDPLTLIAACAVLVVASLAATYLPARRATRIDAMEALRTD